MSSIPRSILVTGGTGQLGLPTVDRLRAAGHEVRVLSRSAGPGHVIGDLGTGAGIAEAVAGVDTILHLATTRKKDAAQTATLLAAAAKAGVRHFVYISIVGVGSIPFPYYVDKRECEKLVEASGVPFTILRATQFHDFVADLLRAERWLPAYIVPDLDDQPIAVEEVADRLAELAGGEPAGRVPDIGGPERSHLRDLTATWKAAHGIRKPVWVLPIPGKTIAAFKAGHHMTPLPGYGRGSFAEFAAREAAE